MKTEIPRNRNLIYFAIIILIAGLAVVFLLIDKEDSPTPGKQANKQKEAAAYIAKIREERFKIDEEITDSTISRFHREERAHFIEKGLQYFEPDLNYRVMADFTIDTSTAVFPFPTNTERTPNYRIYGYVYFNIHDTLCKLTVYQNMDFKNSADYDYTLFLPFMDNTNGIYTYGGGRYMDVPIPESDSILLDFNEAYNPYCAYSSRWSCPLVPFENDLNVSIRAGEKRYK
ncbi:MAG: DUF1684 domain-containing protein [Bacteroidetes bacterium]|nr:MAG: DUF1684 domain-containing protein [Bacteroidota bacterium]RLD73717.1 MAG: DUF1684 domain-containing protein [Bacteroidota bacterium]